MNTAQKTIIGIPIVAIIIYFYLLPLASALIIGNLPAIATYCHTDFPQTEVEVEKTENQNNTTTITANWTEKSKDYPEVIEKLTLRHDHKAERIKIIKYFENSKGGNSKETITLEEYGQKKTTVVNATANELQPDVYKEIYDEHGNTEVRAGCIEPHGHDQHL